MRKGASSKKGKRKTTDASDTGKGNQHNKSRQWLGKKNGGSNIPIRSGQRYGDDKGCSATSPWSSINHDATRCSYWGGREAALRFHKDLNEMIWTAAGLMPKITTSSVTWRLVAR